MLRQPLREVIFINITIFRIGIIQSVAQFAALIEHRDVIALQLPRQARGHANVIGQHESAFLKRLEHGIDQRLRLFGIHHQVRNGKTNQQRQPCRAQCRQPPALLALSERKPAYRGPDEERHHRTEDFIQFNRRPDRMLRQSPRRDHQRRHHADNAKRQVNPAVNA